MTIGNLNLQILIGVRLRLHPNLSPWAKKVLEFVQTLKYKLSCMKQCDDLFSL
jgi:hypothetical protein